MAQNEPPPCYGDDWQTRALYGADRMSEPRFITLTNPDGDTCDVEIGHIAILADTLYKEQSCTQLVMASGLSLTICESRTAIRRKIHELRDRPTAVVVR
jgi:hypothetical protein